MKLNTKIELCVTFVSIIGCYFLLSNKSNLEYGYKDRLRVVEGSRPVDSNHLFAPEKATQPEDSEFQLATKLLDKANNEVKKPIDNNKGFYTVEQFGIERAVFMYDTKQAPTRAYLFAKVGLNFELRRQIKY